MKRRPDPDADLDDAIVLRPAPALDVYSTTDGTVVMVGRAPAHQVIRLSRLGSEILTCVAGGTTMGRLAEDLRESLGEPPEGRLHDLVRTAVIQLRHQRVIVAGHSHKTDNWNDIGS
ncbi:hypothetical protein ASH01_15870 [Terrabacter sp. Soil811]|uniref:hypothetical protein n=1 Tax=Terrabacter sp. Soil811 TaxID=1736419 RepID=UPI0006F80A05|nr:hypothetical protein [Terrabacter sp. Soil811]KRF43275.1 hypothetical protein ASH01_15870 [Terrabacter sp. Soil811]